MIVDANILLYAVAKQAPHHDRAAAWLAEALGGRSRVGLPWQTIGAFVRITTHPRITAPPLTIDEAQAVVDGWLASPAVWVPDATERTWRIFADLARRHHITGNLVPDAQLAALAIEHGVAVVSADTDFARFSGARWVNPLRD